MDFKDDIVAISTPTGMGAIALIRITGDNALMKVEPFFKSRSGTNISDIKSHSIIYGDFTYDDEIIDEVVLSYFAKGKSFKIFCSVDSEEPPYLLLKRFKTFNSSSVKFILVFQYIMFFFLLHLQ